MSKDLTHTITSGGGVGTFLNTEIGTIAVENWCVLQGDYTFGDELELQEIGSKKLRYSKFAADFDQKIPIFFLKVFQCFFILVQQRRILHSGIFPFPARWKSFGNY